MTDASESAAKAILLKFSRLSPTELHRVVKNVLDAPFKYKPAEKHLKEAFHYIRDIWSNSDSDHFKKIEAELKHMSLLEEAEKIIKAPDEILNIKIPPTAKYLNSGAQAVKKGVTHTHGKNPTMMLAFAAGSVVLLGATYAVHKMLKQQQSKQAEESYAVKVALERLAQAEAGKGQISI